MARGDRKKASFIGRPGLMPRKTGFMSWTLKKIIGISKR